MLISKQISALLVNTGRRGPQLVQVCRNFTNKPTAAKSTSNFTSKFIKSNFYNSCARSQANKNPTTEIVTTFCSIQTKKRPTRKKKTLEEGKEPGIYNVVAFATAEVYNIVKLVEGFRQQDLYEPKTIDNGGEAVHAMAKCNLAKESREIFLFREGCVVLWNVTDVESSNILENLKSYEQNSYSERLVQLESEVMNYKYQDIQNKPTCLDKDSNFVLTADGDGATLDKYALSNAMALSVKLGIWESLLEKYIDEIEFVTEDLKRGNKIRMTREEVLRKQGELFMLRHRLNLSSDVLDTPDFYWENERLERLYDQVCAYFCINKRSRVMNEKINYCIALMELLSTHLGDKHNTRLEWMVIVLIMTGVVFEIIHYVDRYVQ